MNSSRQENIPGYLYALDGLRALSLIFIVCFHTWQQSWISYKIPLTAAKNLINLELFQRLGYVAIDSFFVLSGFCLFYPIAREMFGESKFGGWKNFFIKRARRIYPSYIIIIIATLLIPALSYGYDVHNKAEAAKHVLTHLLFIHNISGKTIGSVVSTAWTLAIEIQFYVIFPLLCIPFRKKPVLSFVGMLIFGHLFRFWMIGFTDVSTPLMQAMTPAYLDVFAWGMIAAYFVVYARNKMKRISEIKPLMTLISAVSLIAAVYYMVWLNSSRFGFPEGFTYDVYFRFLYRSIFAGLIAIFIFATCFSCKFWERKIWGNKFFVFLSSISYTVYLWHQNIYIFLKNKNIPYSSMSPVMNDRPAMDSMVLLCFTASVLIGIIVTKYIEGPIVKYGFVGAGKQLLIKLHISEPEKEKTFKKKK